MIWHVEQNGRESDTLIPHANPASSRTPRAAPPSSSFRHDIPRGDFSDILASSFLKD